MDNNNNTSNSIYDKLFILSKTYCYYCQCCNYSREPIYMKHTFTYNDIDSNELNYTNDTNDIWNRMLELTRNRNNSNNYENNEINFGTYIYYTQSEHEICEFNLPILEQRAYLIREFKKKYL